MNLNNKIKFALYGLILLGIAARIYLLPVVSLDMKTYLLPWYDYIVTHGAWASLGDDFSNYTPPYLYLLALLTITKGMLSKVTAIKLLSILFDFFNAYLIYRIVKLQAKQEYMPLTAAALFLCLPTIALNSSAWGQADSIYACFILVSLFYLLQDKPLPALISFGVAFAFKAQAIFLFPFLLLLTFKKRIPWHHYLLVPIIYGIMMTPALVAGRSISSVLEIYLGQAETFKSLSMKAPNLYLLISNDLYTPALYIGIAITVMITLLWAAGYAIKIKDMDRETMIFCATVSVAMIPFLLPKMHERYFYLMDIFTFILAFYIPWMLIPVIGSQLISSMTYLVFLVISPQKPPSPLGAIFLILAVFINTLLIGYLLWGQYKFIQEKKIKQTTTLLG
jgi:Gpi18-like mannosyltransferase